MSTMKPETIAEIAPIAERILSLRAAAGYHIRRAELMEDGSVTGANAAQSQLNRAEVYQSEAAALHTQARTICRAHGDSLPGLAGLEAVCKSAGL